MRKGRAVEPPPPQETPAAPPPLSQTAVELLNQLQAVYRQRREVIFGKLTNARELVSRYEAHLDEVDTLLRLVAEEIERHKEQEHVSTQ